MLTAARIVQTLGGPRVLERKSPTLEGLRAQVRSGLPYAALEAVAARFDIARDDLVALLHVPRRTLARRKHSAFTHRPAFQASLEWSSG